jgi:two-component system sensor histidine kinase PilS (NtrC family)
MSDSRQLFFGTQILMLLAVFLVTAGLATINVGSLGSRHPDQFSYASISYAALSLLFAYFIHRGWPSYITQCRLQILTDIILIIILYYASGGRGAGLEVLLFISVSAAGILLGGRGALAAASAASILLILEHFYVIVTNQRTLGGFTTLGFIGAGLFITAFVIYYLSLLLRKTEKEIAQQNIDLKKLAQLNQLIVEQLHSGVIVVDQKLQLVLINQSGKHLLSINETTDPPNNLIDLLPELALRISQEKPHTEAKETKFTLPSGKMLLTRHKSLGKTYDCGYIILLDDYSQIEKEKRNEKFTAMGRLSASIAHEIRNPLGAISHAGQLLAESPTIIRNDSRLVEIIENQSRRINQIIKTLLELEQSNEQELQLIDLNHWLRNIVETFTRENHLMDNSILLKGSSTVTAYGDPEQLQHVIQNLLANSQRYANTDVLPFVEITIDKDKITNSRSISISDNGPGVAEEIRDKIFEPFFTTSSNGNGLGLYIARKICLSNNGFLEYFHQNDDHNFRITLAGNDDVSHSKDH